MALRSVFTSARVWLCCAILFGIVMGSYAIGFWQPTIIRQTGVRDPFFIGLLTTVPYTLALVSMIATGHHADRTGERRWHVALPVLLAACGFLLCTEGGREYAAGDDRPRAGGRFSQDRDRYPRLRACSWWRLASSRPRC